MSGRSPSGSTDPLRDRRVLLGVTGGIAAYKACILLRGLTERGADVQVVMTEAATRFVGPETFAALSGNPVYTGLWDDPTRVLHVELAHAADVAVVAPATANTLAKIGLGFADDLLTSTLLEATCPLVLAPAMHSGMFGNPATQANLDMLLARGVRVIGPVSGALAAGDVGVGRMAEPQDIAGAVEDALGRGRDLANAKVLITAGPTWEPIDAVRFLGNRSSGKMGFALATEARDRGADVTLVLGPGTPPPPSGLRVIPVGTAEEMRAATLRAAEAAEIVVMAAAVADFRPETAAAGKWKKADGVPKVHLVANPDILQELGQTKGAHQVLVGFAAETQDLEEAGRDKLVRKGLDLIVVNEVGRQGTGFGADTNEALLITRDGPAPEGLRSWTKAELARAVWDRIVALRQPPS